MGLKLNTTHGAEKWVNILTSFFLGNLDAVLQFLVIDFKIYAEDEAENFRQSMFSEFLLSLFFIHKTFS